MKILVVDDNRDNADSLAILLEMDGHETALAYDGEEAVQATQRLEPDVVLLDIALPKLSGYEVCRFIRQQSWGERALVIALTGWGREPEGDESDASARFDAHVMKPAAFEELSAIIRKLSDLRDAGE